MKHQSSNGMSTCHQERKSCSHKIEAEDHADYFFLELGCGEPRLCPCKTNSEFCFLYQSSEVFVQCHSAQQDRKMRKQSDTAPLQCTLSHLPQSAAVFGEEPNSHNPTPPYSPNLTLFNIWFFLSLRIGHPNSTDQDSKSHNKKHQKRTSEVLPAMPQRLDQICMCRRAELSG
jgi:hypothetical protein